MQLGYDGRREESPVVGGQEAAHAVGGAWPDEHGGSSGDECLAHGVRASSTVMRCRSGFSRQCSRHLPGNPAVADARADVATGGIETVMASVVAGHVGR